MFNLYKLLESQNAQLELVKLNFHRIYHSHLRLALVKLFNLQFIINF